MTSMALDPRPPATDARPSPNVWGRLLHELSLEAPSHFPDLPRGARIELLRVDRRLHCEIGELCLAAPGRRILLIAKVLTDPTASDLALTSRARGELANIARYRALLSGSPFQPLRVVGDFSEHRAIVTEKVQGVKLNDLIRRHASRLHPGSCLSRLRQHCEEAGRWLRWAHERSHQGTRHPYPTRAFLDRLEQEALECVPLGLDPGLVRPILARARLILERHASGTWPVVAAHNDFTPENIIVTGRGIVVVDYQAAEPSATPYPDLAIFLTYLETFAKYPLYRATALRALQIAFLDAYGAPWLSPEVLALFEIQALLTLYSYAARRGARPRLKDGMRRLALRRLVNGWIRRVIAVDGRTASPGLPRLDAAHGPSSPAEPTGHATAGDPPHPPPLAQETRRVVEVKKQRQYEAAGDIYEFERYGRLPHMTFYLRFRAEAIAEAIHQRFRGAEALRILDAGCGTGVNLPYLRRCLPRATIVGIDLASRMLRHARGKTLALAKPVHLCQASCFELPCADASYDVLISTRFIHQFPHPLKQAAYREFRRVVRPGGLIIVEFYARPYARLHYLVPRRIAWWRQPDAPQNDPPERYFVHYPTLAEVRDIVGDGFERVPVRPVFCRPLHRVLGERMTKGLTRALRHDPFALLYSEYLTIAQA